MNKAPINYPYYSGVLEATLRQLPYDDEFILLKKNDFDGRVAYVKKALEEAREAAEKFEAKTNPVRVAFAECIN